MYLPAIASTILAWFIGLVLDVNLDAGDPMGILGLRILFPMVVMGVFILRAIDRKDAQ